MKPRARQIIAAMREVLTRDLEMTSFNIAEVLHEDVGTISSYLSGMAKDSLVFRMGLRLQYNGKTRTKHMLWRLNHALIRKLEHEEKKAATMEDRRLSSTMLKVPNNKRIKPVQLDKIRDALVLVQRVPPRNMP